MATYSAGTNTYCCGAAPPQGTASCSASNVKCGAYDKINCASAGGTWSSGWGGGMCSGYTASPTWPSGSGSQAVQSK